MSCKATFINHTQLAHIITVVKVTLTARLHYVGSLREVSAQRDLKLESLHISPICSHFDQHVRGNQSLVPNGFNLVVRLHLHQEWDRSSWTGVVGPCLERFSVVRFVCIF